MLDERELQITTFSSGIRQNLRMRITHMPTGTTVEDSGPSKYRLRESLLESLEAVLNLNRT